MLNKIGYKASLKALSGNIQYTYIQNSKNKVQISVTSAGTRTTRPPSDFLNVLLGCGSFNPNSDASA